MNMQKQVTLKPDESQRVSFLASPATEGNYTVKLDGLVGLFTCISPPIQALLTDLVLANPNNIDEPGNGIYVKAENVVPDGGTFFVATRVVKPYSTIYGTSDDRQLHSNMFLYTRVTIREGYEDWMYIEASVYDKRGGVLLLRKIWYPSDVIVI